MPSVTSTIRAVGQSTRLIFDLLQCGRDTSNVPLPLNSEHLRPELLHIAECVVSASQRQCKCTRLMSAEMLTGCARPLGLGLKDISRRRKNSGWEQSSERKGSSGSIPTSRPRGYDTRSVYRSRQEGARRGDVSAECHRTRETGTGPYLLQRGRRR